MSDKTGIAMLHKEWKRESDIWSQITENSVSNTGRSQQVILQYNWHKMSK